MTVDTQTAKPDSGHAVANAIALLAGFGSRAMAKARRGLRSLQMARMMSMLSHMTDYQLAQIGISRSDIPGYAEKLMAND